MNFDTIIQVLVVAILPLLFAITLHEVAHGWMASKLGDKTALIMGRVTLNPAKHIDPLGTIVLPILLLMIGGFIFGWAKPVPITWQNLKKPKRDMILVALAGPVANFLMALFWAMVAKLCWMLFGDSVGMVGTSSPVVRFIYLAAEFGIIINCALMVLNLLPIPPLDGSRVVSGFLPPSVAYSYEKIEPYGIFILLILMAFGILSYLLLPIIFELRHSILMLFALPPM